MVYILKLLVVGLLSIPYCLIMVVVRLVGRRVRGPYWLARMWCSTVLFLSKVQIRVSGGDELDANQAYVFMANHQSNIDIPALIVGLHRFQLCLVAKKSLFRIPIFGWGLRSCSMIAIERGSLHDAKSGIEQACQRLRDGVSVVVFPEGTRSHDGRLLPFKRGGFVMAQRAGATIVPVTIKGSAQRLAKGSWRVRPGTVEIFIDKVIPNDELKGDSRKLAIRVRQIIGARLASAGPTPAHLAG
jgi:1-acyl-sn-glycerol-3-phosphate acyltransferase